MSKQTEILWGETSIAEIDEWQQYYLSDVADIQTGPFGSQLHSADYVAVGIPSIMPTNIGRRLEISKESIACITEADAQRLSRYLVEAGDIVYSRRGDVEKCAFITEQESGWLCGTGCLRIRFTSEIIHPKFCAYYLSTDEMKGWISSHAVGTTMPNLNSGILKRLPISLPVLAEQRAIAAVLSSLDDKIDLLHRQNATLEALAETLFRQWFIAFEFPNSEGLPYRSNGGAMVESELDEIPKGWRVGAFSELASNYDSKRIPLSRMQREKRPGKFPYYGAASVVDFIDDYLFDGDYLLVGEDGTVITSEGFPVVQRAWGKFWVNNHAHVLQAKAPFTNDYLFTQLNEMNVASIVSGAVQPKITQGNLNAFKVIIPLSSLVENFVEIAQPLFERIKANTNQIQTLSTLRDTLLPKLMSGEVRVAY